MPYTPTVWATGDVITATKLQNLETQYADALVPRESAITTSASPSPDADTDDVFVITALAEAATIANPSGTPVDGQSLIIKVKDDGASRALTWGSAYANGGTVIPTATTAGKQMHVGFLYDTSAAKWYCVGAQIAA